MAGIDPRIWLRCDDEIEMMLLNRIAKEAIKQHQNQRKELADLIISSLDKAMKRGKQNKKG